MSIPFPLNEEERLAELRRYSLLDTPPEKAFDNITQLAATIFDVPIAAVTLIDAERQWFKSCVGLETREVGRNFAFCAYAILGEDVMIVPDARADARFANNPMVTGPPYIRFYAGAPLRTSNGLNLGTLTVSNTTPGTMTKDRAATLAGLATLVVAEIELRYEIGERRRGAESLRLLQAAMQQSSESVIITTANLELPGPEIMYVNPAFTQLTGYTSEEVMGKTPRIFQGPTTERAVLDRVHAHLTEGKEIWFDVANYRKDGSEFVLSCHISPIRGENGEITHFIEFQRDATERNRAAAALLQAKEEAEQANRAKSEFLSRMSHELRTPLHAILGFAQLLEIEGQNPNDIESATQIVRAGKHLLELINEVLDIARVETGNLALTPEPVSVHEALGETLALMEPLAAERNVRVEILPSDRGCEGEVLASARRFRQVLLNLFSNAVKFNRNGGTVTISCERIEDRLRIKIADTGLGISAENMARLFVPFERLEVEDRVIEGTGLGLSLSKHLIEAMGGKIGVESVPGSGTTFWIELPLIQAMPASTTRSLDVRVERAEESSRRTTPRAVLYIEDNLSNLRLVERILARRPEVKLISAVQGSIGIELARQHQPDLILLDLHLPDMLGDEVLRQLRADPETAALKVVIISADATSEQREHLRAVGANSYLTKPIDVREFLALIDATEPHSASSLKAANEEKGAMIAEKMLST
jgi:PAS domain S-box-containing protein